VVSVDVVADDEKPPVDVCREVKSLHICQQLGRGREGGGRIPLSSCVRPVFLNGDEGLF